jgi:catechol 2,3-dioxygenase-like lactoylglutathione lyase family enzyme
MRLDLVAILVPEYDAGIAFFTGIGFRLLEDTDRGGGKRWVVVEPEGGGSAILIARAVGEQREAIGRQAGGRVGFFLGSADFDGDARRIEMAGGVFEEAPRDETYGRVAVFRDPFGNRWDLVGRKS